MVVSTRMEIDKEYFIGELAYHILENGDAVLHKLSAQKAIEIVRASARKYGSNGWVGASGSPSRALGKADLIARYEICYDKAEQFFNLKTRLINCFA